MRRFGIIKRLVSETSVEVYILYDKILLEKVDQNITNHGLGNRNLRKIIQSTSESICYHSIYLDVVDIDMIEDLVNVQYTIFLDPHAPMPSLKNVQVVGHIFFKDGAQKSFCDISYFKMPNPQRTISRFISGNDYISSSAAYLQMISNIEWFKLSMKQWLKSRSSVYEKAGTRSLEFT